MVSHSLERGGQQASTLFFYRQMLVVSLMLEGRGKC